MHADNCHTLKYVQTGTSGCKSSLSAIHLFIFYDVFDTGAVFMRGSLFRWCSLYTICNKTCSKGLISKFNLIYVPTFLLKKCICVYESHFLNLSNQPQLIQQCIWMSKVWHFGMKGCRLCNPSQNATFIYFVVLTWCIDFESQRLQTDYEDSDV